MRKYICALLLSLGLSTVLSGCGNKRDLSKELFYTEKDAKISNDNKECIEKVLSVCIINQNDYSIDFQPCFSYGENGLILAYIDYDFKVNIAFDFDYNHKMDEVYHSKIDISVFAKSVYNTFDTLSFGNDIRFIRLTDDFSYIKIKTEDNKFIRELINYYLNENSSKMCIDEGYIIVEGIMDNKTSIAFLSSMLSYYFYNPYYADFLNNYTTCSIDNDNHVNLTLSYNEDKMNI